MSEANVEHSLVEHGSVDRGLAAQQSALARMIRAGDVSDGDPSPATSVAALLPLRDHAPRLNIYQNAYRARLTEALRSNFPILHRVLGDDAFAALAGAFIEAHPSRRASIRWFGEYLVAYLQADHARVPHPALIDLARMEWAIGLSFDATDAAPVDFATLAACPPDSWPELRFAAHPAVQWLELDWAVEPMWRALTGDSEAETAAPMASPHTLLIWRVDLDTRWRSIDAFEAALLRVCLAGAAFGELCEVAAAHVGDDAAAQAAGWLRRWVDDGVLCLAS